MAQFDLTEDERYGLIEAVDRATGEAHDYQQNGSPHQDYGDEWPDVARERARRWRDCASAIRKLTAVALADDCENVAADLEASAREYPLEHGGTMEAVDA